MNGLDLFSGIGGISLALEPWVRTVAYCEQDRYAQGVLMSRMRSCELESAPIWDDVRTLRAEHFGEPVDIIFGGFPCQDTSPAGRGAGLGGERSRLFFDIVRLADGLRPSFVFLENSPALTTRSLGVITGCFTEIGYDCRWTVVSAAEVGASQIRERLFLLAHAESERRCEGGPEFNPRQRVTEFTGGPIALDRNFWLDEPTVARMVHGFPNRVDRIRCLGNAVVPLAAREAFIRLAGLER